jgi:hypothetical protein
MQIFFDESGDFSPVDVGAEKFCYVLGLIVPETSIEELRTDFEWFVSQLTSHEFDSGEPKGALLTSDHRRLLLQILKLHRNVTIVPLSVNLGYSGRKLLSGAPAKIRSLIEGNLPVESSYMTKAQRAELARRFGRLSPEALSRIMSYAIAILKSIEAIANRYYCEQFHRCYDPITATIDRVAKPGSREELVFKDSIHGWIANWSRRVPLKRNAHVDRSHPLFALYGDVTSGELVFDTRKMLKGNIGFADSRRVWQVRLTDFLVNTWSQVVGDHGRRSEYHKLFRDLYQKSALPNESPLGAVSLTEETSVVAAPSYFEIFARMIEHDPKILPCE